MTHEPQQPPTEEDRGFVVRGFVMLGLMLVLAMVVLLILFQKPAPTQATDPAGVPLEPSAKGWEVRYNAALALARRGSASAPWETIAEMLDEKQQLRNFRLKIQGGKDLGDEGAARGVVLNALQAVRQWREKQTNPPVANAGSFELVRTKIDALAAHSVAEVKVQAEKTRQALK